MILESWSLQIQSLILMGGRKEKYWMSEELRICCKKFPLFETMLIKLFDAYRKEQ